MKKITLYLLLACSASVFGSNSASDKVMQKKQQTENVVLNQQNNHSIIHLNADDYFNLSAKRILTQKEEKKSGKKNRNKFDFLQSYLQKTEEKAIKRLDSCIAKDINGKIFAKDYYYYFPYGSYPAGALQSNELWNLDEEKNDWHGFRMSATYDEFGNANNRLIELFESGQWTPNLRYTALYTSLDGELTLDMVEMYENGEWIGDSKRTTTFDTQGRKTLVNIFIWDRDSKDWVNIAKTDYTYVTGKSTELGYDWIDGTWVQATRIETFTDQNGNITQAETCFWDNEKNDWRTDMKIENEYDQEGNLTQTINYNYSEEYGELLPFGKEIHINDNNINIVENYGYNNETKKWDGISKTQEKYVDDLLVEDYFYSWSNETREWVNDTKGTCEYNENGKPTLKSTYRWDGATWKSETKSDYEYNEYGYESHNIGYIFDFERNGWIKANELIQRTDSEGRVLLMEPYMLDEEGNWVGAGYKEVYELDENGKSIRDEFSMWNAATGEWQIDEIADYFYTLITSDIKEKKETEINVTSINGNLNIANAENEKVCIYTANGSLIYQANATSNNLRIPINKGFYIVRVGEYSFKINVR